MYSSVSLAFSFFLSCFCSPESSDFSQASDTIQMMSKGAAFIKYDHEFVTEQTTRTIVIVFYKKDSQPLGSLYCKDICKTKQPKKIPLVWIVYLHRLVAHDDGVFLLALLACLRFYLNR